MEEKKQLNREDKKLIKGCINKDPRSIKEFYDRYVEKIYSIAYRFLQNSDDAKDARQEMFLMLLEKMKEYEITTNLNGWVSKVTKNYFIDQCRAKKTVQRRILKREAYLKPEKRIYKKITIDDIEESIDISIEYFKELYKLKNEIDTIYKLDKYSSIYRLSLLFHKTKKGIDFILGHNPPSREIIKRYQEIKEPPSIIYGTDEEEKRLEKEEQEKKELEKKFKDQLFIYEKLYELIDYFDYIIRDKIVGPDSSLSLPGLWGTFEDFVEDIPKLNISPPVLIFRVWIRNNELKIGKKINLTKLKVIFAYYKKKTKGTEKEFLFKSIPNEDITSREFKKKFETIRQLSYRSRKSSNNKLYKKLERFIYKKSFVEKISPD